MFGIDELGMDIGSSTFHIVARGKGIVLSEPAYVAYDTATRDVIEVGNGAKELYGRTPQDITCVCPMREGQIRGFDLLDKMIHNFVWNVIGKRNVFRPTMIVAFPGRIAPGDRQSLVNSLVDSGIRSVIPVDENVAAAIGAKVDIDQPKGRLHIDIGGGRTNVSIFSLGHQISWEVFPIGGDQFDNAIMDYLRLKRSLLIGASTAEDLKINIGCASAHGPAVTMEACGRSLVSGLPRSVSVTSEEIADALTQTLLDLSNRLRRMIEGTSPELANDIFENGISLSGGAAQLSGLDTYLTEQLGIRVTLAEEPALCTPHGLMELIDNADRYENIDFVAVTSDKRDREDNFQ